MNDELRALVFWLPARLVNPLNTRGHWTLDAKRARIQRDAVCAAVYQALDRKYTIRVAPGVPKHVHFEAHVARAFDGDGLQAALKHVRDGLIDAGLIDDDAPILGHVFTYTQLVVGRHRLTRRGVRITVTVKGSEPCRVSAH